MDLQPAKLTQEAAQAASIPTTPATPENAPQATSGTANAIASPHIVSEWQKNNRETIRITLSKYQGRPIIDARQWYSGNDGELKPSPKGLSLAISHLPALAAGFADALDIARRHGLVEGDDQ